MNHYNTGIMRIVPFICSLFLISGYCFGQDGQQVVTLKGHSAGVEGIAFSPNGKLLASGGWDYNLKIWDVSDQKEIASYSCKGYEVRCVAFNPAGTLVAAGTRDNYVRVFSLTSKEPVAILKGHGMPIRGLAFSPDGRILASSSGDRSIKLWDTEKYTLLHTLKWHGASVNAVIFSPDGKLVVSAGSDNAVKVWNPQTGELIRTISTFKSGINAIAYSSDGRYIAFGGFKEIKVMDSNSWQEVESLKGHTDEVTSLAFSPNGTALLSGGNDRLMLLWDWQKGEILTTTKDPNKINSVAFSPNGKVMASAGDDKTVKLYGTSSFSKADELIRTYVEAKINEWQKKGKFEKSEVYQQRVNETTRKKKVDEVAQFVIDSLGQSTFTLSNATNEYDADNESYKITFANGSVIYLKVPLADAESFDANFKSMKYKNAKFTFSGDRFEIVHMEFVLPTNGKKYLFDTRDAVTYNASQLALNFEPIEVAFANADQQKPVTPKTTAKSILSKSDVDVNIPTIKIPNNKVYALIIGNEDYTTSQKGLNKEVNVDFAVNDATVFAEYCNKTMGIPEKQIKLLTNATAGQMAQGIEWLSYMSSIEKGAVDVIFYYSGHGLPDETTKEPYLIPVDVSGTSLKYAIKLEDVYQGLIQNEPRRAIVFLDACFSGGARNQSLVAMKGVKVRPKENAINGNMVVFTSSSGEEASAVYREQQHGYFTYFLLKNFQETKGNVTFSELADYVKLNVMREAGLISKKQTPQVLVSPSALDIWRTWRLK